MVVYECEYMVDSRDIDPWYHCRPSGLMGMLQEAAWDEMQIGRAHV